MFKCTECGSEIWQHHCPNPPPAFSIKEPGVVMVPRDAEALAAEVDRLHLQVDRYRKALEEIAAIPPTGDGHLMRAQNIADEMVGLKPKCGLSKPMGVGETCVLEVGHLGPCGHTKKPKNEHCKNGPDCAAYDCSCPCAGCVKMRGPEKSKGEKPKDFVMPLCDVQVGCFGECGKLLPCEDHPGKRSDEALWKCFHCGSRRMSTVLHEGMSHCLDCCNNTKV